MRISHPADPLRHLDLLDRPDRVGIVQGRDLNVHQALEYHIVEIEEPGPAAGAEWRRPCSDDS